MSDTKLKCPFCQQELVEIQFGEQRYWSCINDECDKSVGLGGNKKLWQELIETKQNIELLRTKNIDRVRSCGNCNDMLKELNRTREALETAIRSLKYIADGNLGFTPAVEDFAEKALEQINKTKGRL